MEPAEGVNAGAAEQGQHTASDRPWEGLEGRDRYAAAVRAAQTGDKAAFEALVKDLAPLVWHVARGAGLDRPQAEDVVQTVWLALVRHLHRLTEPRALASWLITTTRREATRVRQQRATEAGSEALDEAAELLVDESPQPEERFLRDEQNRRLSWAFQRLTRREQEVLRLTTFPGRPEYREAALALGMPVGSIGPTRGRALNKLRRLYEEMGGDPGARYVPLSRPLSPTAARAELWLWRLGTELVMPVYTSKETLRTELGTDRPWVEVNADRLADLLAVTRADRFVTDRSPATVRATPETVPVDRHRVPMIGSPHLPAPEPVSERDALVAELQGLLRNARPPAGPVTEPWALAYQELGELRITPTEIEFDGERASWDKVTEVRLRQISDYVNADALRLQVDTPALREAVLTVVIAAGGARVPAEIEYVDHRARRKSLHAGAVTALFLTDPAVRESVLATARANDVPIHAPAGDEAAVRRGLEAELASLRADER